MTGFNTSPEDSVSEGPVTGDPPTGYEELKPFGELELLGWLTTGVDDVSVDGRVDEPDAAPDELSVAEELPVPAPPDAVEESDPEGVCVCVVEPATGDVELLPVDGAPVELVFDEGGAVDEVDVEFVLELLVGAELFVWEDVEPGVAGVVDAGIPLAAVAAESAALAGTIPVPQPMHRAAKEAVTIIVTQDRAKVEASFLRKRRHI